MSLSSALLNAIPLHSFHLAICDYSFTVLQYYAFVATFSVLTLLHYCTYVLLSKRREADASLFLTAKSVHGTHIARFIEILDDRCA